MKKLIGLLVLAIMIVAAIVVRKKEQPKSIAIITTLSHGALSTVREGFIEEFRKTERDIAVVDYNAEGNVQQATLIAGRVLETDNVVGILAIGTLAAQTIAKVERNVPIVIAAVSDSQSILSRPDPQDNVCGLTDGIDADFQIASIKKLLPHIKNVSLLYSPQEANATFMVNNLERAARISGLRASLVGVHEAQHIPLGARAACEKSDAVVITLDNLLVSAMPAVIKGTVGQSCAIIASNEEPIHQGATIAFGVDYRESGITAARIMARVLGNESPKDIGFIAPSMVDIFVNDQAINDKHIELNDDLGMSIHHVKIKG